MIVKYISLFDDLWIWYVGCCGTVRLVFCNSGVETSSAYKSLEEVRTFQRSINNPQDIIYDSGEE